MIEPLEDFVRETFSRRMKATYDWYLINRGMTMRAQSIAIGINHATLAKYVEGKAFPNSITLAMIAKFYCISTDWLVGLSDNPRRSE